MNGYRSNLAALALLACVVTASARPSADPTGATPDASLATCPHVLHTLATPEQVSGSWYMYEVMGDASVAPRVERTPMSCFRYDIAGEGQQFILVAYILVNGSVDVQNNFTYTKTPSGRWQHSDLVTDRGFFMGLSSDGNLLLICGDFPHVMGEDALRQSSTALGRVPTVASVEQLEAARRPPAPGTQRVGVIFDNAGHCGSPSQ